MNTAAPQLTDDPVFHLLEQARQFILRLTAYIDSIFERLGTAPRDLSASFTRRLLALHAALNDPHAAAARWLRRHFAARVPKGCPLSPHRIPSQRKSLPAQDQVLFRELTDCVFTLFFTDTS